MESKSHPTARIPAIDRMNSGEQAEAGSGADQVREDA
jgi:hypothetical protein